MKKRIVSMILTSVMAMSLLAGCGADVEEKQEVAKKSTASSEQTSNKQSSVEEKDDLSETVVITVATSRATAEGDYNELLFVKEMEERFNVDFQFSTYSSETWTEKWPLLFASNELPDVFFKDVDCSIYGPQGYFVPLEDYITEEATPNIWKMWQEKPQIKAISTAADGHIYYLQGIDEDEFQRDKNRFYINEVWANEIIGKHPETVDEFYDYLVGVRDKDMDGDGDPNNEIPLGGSYTAGNKSNELNILSPILAAFGHLNAGIEVQDDGSVIDVSTHEDYKEFLKYMNKLWEEGLVDSEFFTMDSSQANAKNSIGLYGATAGWMISSAHPENYEDYSFIAPMTSAINDVQMQIGRDVRTFGGFCINSESENVERILMVMDWLFSEEATIMSTCRTFDYGEIEEYPEMSMISFVDEETGNRGTKLVNKEDEEVVPEGYASSGDFVYAFVAPTYGAFPGYVTWSAYSKPGTPGGQLVNETLEYHAPYYKTALPVGVVLSETEGSEISLLDADLTPYQQEMETKMIRGEVDIDEIWDTYVKGMKDRGIDRKVEIYQNAYDRYAENLK